MSVRKIIKDLILQLENYVHIKKTIQISKDSPQKLRNIKFGTISINSTDSIVE